jgi:hypothetical protein
VNLQQIRDSFHGEGIRNNLSQLDYGCLLLLIKTEIFFYSFVLFFSELFPGGDPAFSRFEIS